MHGKSDNFELIQKLLPVVESLREWTDESLESVEAFAESPLESFSSRVAEHLDALAAKVDAMSPPPPQNVAAAMRSAVSPSVLDMTAGKRLSVALRELEEYLKQQLAHLR